MVNHSSKKPSTTRKLLGTLAAHSRSKKVAAHLNEKLAKEFERRSIPLRKDDTVKIVRGDFKGKTGKILRIDRKIAKIFVEKVIRKKSDVTEFEVAIDPSKVIVLEIQRDDKKRIGKNRDVKKGGK